MKKLVKIVLIPFVALMLSACDASKTDTDMQISENTTRDMERVFLQNGDSYDIVASEVTKSINGVNAKMLAYNGSIPGPLIFAPQDSTVTINFTNNTELANTIHPHGIRVKNEFDGVPDLTQKPVLPGETFTYELNFPDAGTFWYHPHMREDMTQELGLYGNFVVTPKEEGYFNIVNREEFLFLDDILINQSGAVSFDKESISHTLMGRYGNMMLVNGEENFKMNFQKGEVVRFTLTNSANARPFNISIPEARMKLIGSDIGRYENETFIENVIIGPAERYTLEVFFENSGTYELVHETPGKTYKLAEFKVSEQITENDLGSNFSSLRTNLGDTRSVIPNLDELLDKQPDKLLKLTLDTKMMGKSMDDMHSGMQGMPCHKMPNGSMMGNCNAEDGESSGIEWEDDMKMMNEISNDKTITWKIIDEQSGKENMDINWDFTLGDLVKVRIFNDPDSMHPMQHPIHFHGQRFIVLSRDNVKEENLVWKDTTLVKTGETVDVLIEMSNPGAWMAHCHIAEHLHSGMMLKYNVK